MSSNSSESESSYHSDSEDVREYSDYEREVELSSKDESTQSEADSSVQGESAMCADDPVADAEWTAKYEKNMMEIKEQETRMNSRLDGSVEISEWYAYIKIYLWLYIYSSKIVKMLQWLWLQIV